MAFCFAESIGPICCWDKLETIKGLLPRVAALSAVPPVRGRLSDGANDSVPIMPVAEPASITLLGIALLGLCLWTRRKLS